MKSIGNVLEARTPTYSQSAIGTNEDKPIDNSSIVNSDKIDRALEKTADLMEPSYKKWFAKAAIQLGPDRYLGIAADAREGKHPKRLFVYLIKRATWAR